MYRRYTSFDDMIRDESLKKVKRVIVDNFSYHISRVKSNIFFVEDYIESEWRDIYSIYYSKLNKTISNSTKRIHFISEDIDDIKLISDTNYNGYITIRPIGGKLSLSRVRLRYDCSFYETKAMDVIEQKTVVNFPHISISYDSFPFFRQDGMVTVCAHADIHMLIKTMHKRHKFNHYGITNILKKINNNHGRDIPSEGLSMNDMVKALKERGFNPLITQFKKGKYILQDGEIEIEKYSILDFLDSMIESALPVILAYDGHVIILAGISKIEDKYLFFDDSGAHLSKLDGDGSNFSKLISKSEILEKLSFQQEEAFVLVPTFKSFYFRYKTLLEILITDTKYSRFFQSKKRILLVQSSRVKQHLNYIGIEELNSTLLPNYVWFIEIYKGDKVSVVCLVDASEHQHIETIPFIYSKDENGQKAEIFFRPKIELEIKLLKEVS